MITIEEYNRQAKLFQELSSARLPFFLGKKPCLDDDLGSKVDRHYIFHSAWAARILAKLQPQKHVDISSSFYFNTIVSAFIPIDFYDYHNLLFEMEGLHQRICDLTALQFTDSSIPSLSCMHVVEHIGLGRYGDKIDPDGDLKAVFELNRVLAPEGNLLFVVPITGAPRIMFNAHRIYSYDQIMSYFSGLKLMEFALIPDDAHFNIVRNAPKEMADKEGYGCGCFWFRKERTMIVEDLLHTPKRCHKCQYLVGMSACSRVGGCYKPIKTRIRHFWWRISNPFRKCKFCDP